MDELEAKFNDAIHHAEQHFGDGSHWVRNHLPHIHAYVASLKAQIPNAPIADVVAQPDAVPTIEPAAEETPVPTSRKGAKA